MSSLETGNDTPKPFSLFETTNSLYLKTVQDWIDTLKKDGVIYLENGPRIFGFNDKYFEECDHVFSDNLSYPTTKLATLEDVRYITWKGGEHVYAKVGNLDIVDENGNQKWNTRKEAEEAAYNYITKKKVYI